MALSAVAATIAEYKRALATNDFADEMTLDPRERALVTGTADHTLTYASPHHQLEASNYGGRRSTSDGIFNLIAGPDRFINKEVRARSAGLLSNYPLLPPPPPPRHPLAKSICQPWW